ncbi:MAG: hypothetical protein ACJA0W_004444, partial [Candidatus Azotimanducaceae bacterium]
FSWLHKVWNRVDIVNTARAKIQYFHRAIIGELSS